MKTTKILRVLLVLTLLVGLLSVNALAAGGNTVTITSETTGHTYQAYQVFAGDYSESGGTGILSNITWGSGVNGSNLLTALKADATYGSHFTGCTSAAQAAVAISTISDTGFADAYAKIVAQNLTGIYTSSGSPSGSGPYTYTITGLADGYYFVKEANQSGSGQGNSYTKYILKVVDNVTVAAKTDSPAVMKKVKENNDATYRNTWNDGADYNIGDAIPFRIVGLVPDMSYFTTYYYQINDTMSSGLTFNSASVKVYFKSGSGTTMLSVATDTAVGAGGTLIPAASYTLAAAGNGFTITFTNLKTVSGISKDGYIVVEYTAALNSGAVIADGGNPNEVYLKYSNNPNDTSSKDTTPKDEVVVFTFNLPVNKVDEDNHKLTGATFALFTDETAANTAAGNPSAANLASALKFTGSAGNYVLNASGSYTLASDADGKYTMKGLDQGTYYLVEITAPTGFNRLTEPVVVEIGADYNTARYVNGHAYGQNDLLNGYTINGPLTRCSTPSLTVVNKAGVTLPETGGIGTTIFTVTGLLLMVGVAIVFVTSRKMASRRGR